MTERPWQKSFFYALIAVAVVLGTAFLVARSKSKYPFYGSVYSGEPASSFVGVDQDNKSWEFVPVGKTTFLFFGFTHCPDICPLTLKYLSEVRNKLEPQEKEQLQIVFVSVDPKRDTPEVMGDYLNFFGSEGKAIVIEEPYLSEVAQKYNVIYGVVPVEGPLEYQVNHTTATYLIDKNGNIRVLWDYTQLSNIDRIVSDTRYVMNNPKPKL